MTTPTKTCNHELWRESASCTALKSKNELLAAIIASNTSGRWLRLMELEWGKELEAEGKVTLCCDGLAATYRPTETFPTTGAQPTQPNIMSTEQPPATPTAEAKKITRNRAALNKMTCGEVIAWAEQKRDGWKADYLAGKLPHVVAVIQIIPTLKCFPNHLYSKRDALVAAWENALVIAHELPKLEKIRQFTAEESAAAHGKRPPSDLEAVVLKQLGYTVGVIGENVFLLKIADEESTVAPA